VNPPHPVRVIERVIYDDSVNYFKHALCQVEIERTQAIAARYIVSVRYHEARW